MRKIYLLDQCADRRDAPEDVRVSTSVEEFLEDLRGATEQDMAAIVSHHGLWMFWSECNVPFLSAQEYVYLTDGVEYTYCRRISCLEAVRDVVQLLVDGVTP